ncbi:MAG: trypsin-like peptidase domain-containing protein, partial [Cyanobacteria bacterium J06642_3]
MTKSTFSKQVTTSLSLVLLGGGMALGGNYLLNSPQSFAQDSDDEALRTKSITLELPQNYVSNVVSQVGDSVVRINASRKVATKAPVMFDDPFFRQLFGEQIPHIPDQQIQQGMGSGFVVSTDGLIWTNAHVIKDSDQVEVTLKDGRTFKAEVMGTDSLTDIGVIKIDAVDLPAVKIADSDTLQPGEYAIAIGNPLGLNNTVTTGIPVVTVLFNPNGLPIAI